MNYEVAAIAAFFNEKEPDLTIYFDVMPEGMRVPCIYFPSPSVTDGDYTSTHYKKTYVLPVKVFHINQHEAVNLAERLADYIRRKRRFVPLRDPEGNIVNKFIFIRSINTRLTDSGDENISVALLSLEWETAYRFDYETSPVMARLEDINVKGAKQ
jgi:hypothetical protein